MPGAGIIGASTARYRRRRVDIGATSITATITPASSVLVVGEALNDMANWFAFSALANYATDAPGETIADVQINYIGDTATAATPFAEGDTNAFSVTVTDTGGAVRIFSTTPRTVLHAPPTVLGSLADQSITRNSGNQTYDVSVGFVGLDLTFSIVAPAGVLVDSTSGFITFETDTLAVQSGTPVTVTATNSGGSVQGGFTFDVFAPVLADLTGLTTNATHGLTAQIGMQLTGSLANLLGTENVVHRWVDDGGVIAGASLPTYTPTVAQDLETLRYSPTVDGIEVTSASYTIRHAPAVADSLLPVVQTQGSGTVQVNVAAGFTGFDLSYSEAVTWASISGDTLTINDEVRTDTIPISATNSGGSVTVDLSVTITPLLVILSTPIADQSIEQNSGDTSLDLGNFFDNATSYTVSGSPSVSLDSDGFILRISDASLITGDVVTVTATNANNSIQDQFLVNVHASSGSEFSVEATGEEPIITIADADPNTLVFTISGGTSHDGSYTADYLGDPITVARLGNAQDGYTPICLARPTISGGTNPGDTLTTTPGLWLYGGDDPGDPTWTQRLDGFANGGTGLEYLIRQGDAGKDFNVEESFGAMSVTSANTVISSIGFSPTDLGSKLHTWLDFTDGNQLYQDTGRTIAVTTLGQSVQGITDKSGNGHDFTSTDAVPIWDASNGQVRATAVNITSAWNGISAAAGTTSTMEIYAALKVNDTKGMLLASDDPSYATYLGAWHVGSGSAGLWNSGSPSFYADGVALAGTTRGEAEIGWNANTGVVMSVHAVDLLGWEANARTMRLFNADITTLGYEFDYSVTHFIITGALTESERSNLQIYLQTRIPV